MATATTPGPDIHEPRRHRGNGGRGPADAVGRFLLGLAVLVASFAAFRTWGTDLLEWHAQRQLQAELAVVLQPVTTPSAPATTAPPTTVDTPSTPLSDGSIEATTTTTTPPTTATSTATSTTAAPAGHRAAEPLREGQVIGRIEIPSLGLSKVVLHGVQRATLRQGPGHYPGTPLPGQPGNVAIAGHRTTYGAPFLNLDQLQPGDLISLETGDGRFWYAVEAQTGRSGQQLGHRIVSPGDLGVVGDHQDNRLTLTACHPKRSSRQRIVVSALPVEAPVTTEPVLTTPVPSTTAGDGPATTGTTSSTPTTSPTSTWTSTSTSPGSGATTTRPVWLDSVGSTSSDAGEVVGGDELDGTYGWDLDELASTAWWTAMVVSGAMAGRLSTRVRRGRWAAQAIAAIVFVPLLFVWFIHLDRLLPAF